MKNRGQDGRKRVRRQRAIKERRFRRAKTVMDSMLPIWKVAIGELRDAGGLSRGTREKLRSLSKAISEVYPPEVTLDLMKRAFEAGHVEAAIDALLLCAKEKTAVPRWALEGWAESRRSDLKGKEGRPARHPWVDLWRVWAVERCARQGYRRDKRGDKYDRAHRLLKTINPRAFAGLPVVVSPAAIKKSYRDFRRTRGFRYMSLEFTEAALQDMLFRPVVEMLRRRN